MSELDYYDINSDADCEKYATAAHKEIRSLEIHIKELEDFEESATKHIETIEEELAQAQERNGELEDGGE